MKIEEFHIYTYHLPILQPLQIGKTFVSSRSGAIIHFKTNTNILSSKNISFGPYNIFRRMLIKHFLHFLNIKNKQKIYRILLEKII